MGSVARFTGTANAGWKWGESSGQCVPVERESAIDVAAARPGPRVSARREAGGASRGVRCRSVDVESTSACRSYPEALVVFNASTCDRRRLQPWRAEPAARRGARRCRSLALRGLHPRSRRRQAARCVPAPGARTNCDFKSPGGVASRTKARRRRGRRLGDPSVR